MDKHLQQLRRQVALGDPDAQERYLQARTRAGMRNLLGMSLSFGIKTLLQGSVTEDEVTQIIGSTTGFAENGKPGPNYQTIRSRYMESYWCDYSCQEVDDVLETMLPRITEVTHGLPGTWVDASKPHYWGWVPHGCNLGVVGDYINTETNETCYSATMLHERLKEEDVRFGRFMDVAEQADKLNKKYGFKPLTRHSGQDKIAAQDN